MPRYLIRIDDDRQTPPTPHYFEWSTVVDCPVEYWATRSEMVTSMVNRFGELAHERIARLDATGTSAIGETLEGILFTNRAGLEETRLNAHQIIDTYVFDHEKPHGEVYNWELDLYEPYVSK